VPPIHGPARDAPPSHPPVEPPARRTVGQSRRLGLGAPTSRPASEPFHPPGTPETPPPSPPRPPAAALPAPVPAALPPLVPAPVPAPPPPVSESAPVPAERTEPVPYDLAHDLRTAHGVDVSAVPVHRGPDVDGTAEQLGAKAYTVSEEVHLPAAAGETTGPEARALVAHELVHVAQQRALGARLPDESSPAGAVLEAEAAAVEAAGRSGQPLPPPDASP